ncbi:MAG: LEA type 2 family protein [Candidatus Sericytochromatia bacterium]|nr:LEA type 2 family protein [Candidatus Tanganyikabacteria bacterium]
MIKLRTALLVALLPGCGLWTAFAERQAITKAEFSFKSAAVTRVDLPFIGPDPRADLDVTLLVKNPNSIAAALDRLDYQVYVSGQQIGAGSLAKDFRVEAGATRDLVLPVSIRYEGLAQPVLDAILRREVALTLKGTSHLATPVGSLDFPVEVSGKTAF